MGVVNKKASVLLADSCLNTFELHMLNYLECLEKSYVKYQNGKNILVVICMSLHI